MPIGSDAATCNLRPICPRVSFLSFVDLGINGVVGDQTTPLIPRSARKGLPGSGRESEAEFAELAGVALPVLGHAYVQIEVDPGAEKLLDLVAGPGADLAQPGAAGPDHD